MSRKHVLPQMTRSVVAVFPLLSWLRARFPCRRKFFHDYHTTRLAIFPIMENLSTTSFAITLLISVPVGSNVLEFTSTAALSLNFTLVPSDLLNSFFCLTMTQYTIWCMTFSFPFLTAHMTTSPTPALGFLRWTPRYPFTAIISSSFAPELSAHFMRDIICRALGILAVTAFISYQPPRIFLSLTAGGIPLSSPCRLWTRKGIPDCMPPLLCSFSRTFRTSAHNYNNAT